MKPLNYQGLFDFYGHDKEIHVLDDYADETQSKTCLRKGTFMAEQKRKYRRFHGWQSWKG